MYQLTNIAFYDIESYQNFFCVSFKSADTKKTFVIYKDRNDAEEIVRFIFDNKLTVVGHNIRGYDNILINFLIESLDKVKTWTGEKTAKILNNLSNAIIKEQNLDKHDMSVDERARYDAIQKLKYNTKYPYIDTLEVTREGYQTKGLKAIAINLKWHRIQDLPYPYDHIVKDDEVDTIIEYNWNDVDITERLYQEILPRLQMREILSNKYAVNVMSEADSAIAKVLFNVYYSKALGDTVESFQYHKTIRKEVNLNEVVFPWVSFKTHELQEFERELRKIVITNVDSKAEFPIPDKYFYKEKGTPTPKCVVPFRGMNYTIAMGGIHSLDTPGIITAGEDEYLLDIDVSSQYPMCIINNRVVPKHLKKDAFINTYKTIVDDRLANKDQGKKDNIAKVMADGLKIGVNTWYGLFNYIGFCLYDPLCTYLTTINNQLGILMLIEDMALNGIEIISANTDGILLRFKKTDMDLVQQIKKQWEATTGFVLEDTLFTKVIRKDINNYMAISVDGKAKVKGCFIPQGGILKGFDKPIVAIALKEYFMNGTRPTDVFRPGFKYTFVNATIKGEEREVDIYDFCMAQKIGTSYIRVEYDTNDKTDIVQRSVRYYASNGGGKLYKIKYHPRTFDPVTGEVFEPRESRQTLLSDSNVTLFNDFQALQEYDINLSYYEEEVECIIAQIEGREYYNQEDLLQKLSKLDVRIKKLDLQWEGYESTNRTHLKAAQVVSTQREKVLEEIRRLLPFVKQNGQSELSRGEETVESDSSSEQMVTH